MRSLCLSGAFLLVAAVTAAAADDEPAPRRAADLALPVPITAAGEPIEVQGFAAPFVGDIDGDGKQDLLVGQSHLGLLRLYRNEGTNAQPKFTRSEWVTAAGRVASVPRCCRVGFTPQLVDFDGDGDTDIVTGAGAGEAYVFRRNQDGSFAEAEVLIDKHGQVIMRQTWPSKRRVPYNSMAFACDWEQDGDLDLLVRTCLYPNLGTRAEPVFGDAVQIEADAERISQGIYAPCVADWDGDGKNDLLAILGSNILWYRNTGDNSQPVFAAPEVLVQKTSESPYSLDRPDDEPGVFQAFCVVDFNSDGRLDLVVGDFRNRRLPELDEQQQAEMKKNMTLRSDAGRDYWSFMRDRQENMSSQELIETSRQNLRKWQDYATAAAEDQFFRDRCRQRGRVWFYERVATPSK